MDAHHFWLTEKNSSRGLSRIFRPTRAASRGSMTAASSAASFMFSSPAADGSMPRRSTARRQDTLQPLRPLGRERCLGGDLPGVGGNGRPAGATADRFLGGQGSSQRLGRKRGEANQAIGRSRGGRGTKIHALADRFCRPVAFHLTGAQVADCVAADALLDRMPATDILNGDKGYDSDAVRRKIENLGVAPNIPPKSNRRWKNCFSPVLYRGPQRRRAYVRPPQGLPQDRHPLRPSRPKLPRRRLSCRYDLLLVMSPGPRSAWRFWRVSWSSITNLLR